jgi:haloacetate dehalogenase
MNSFGRTVRANGIRQHYLEAGDGPPVVLLHGFPETSYAWRYQIPQLAKKCRVIAPDLRGYGETDKPLSGYDKRTMAMDLRELIRALNLPRIALWRMIAALVSQRASQGSSGSSRPPGRDGQCANPNRWTRA